MDDMEGYCSLFNKRRLLNSAASLTALGEQFVISLLMAGSHQEKASWNDKETQAFVEYLSENTDKITEEMTFRDPVFNASGENDMDL